MQSLSRREALQWTVENIDVWPTTVGSRPTPPEGYVWKHVGSDRTLPVLSRMQLPCEIDSYMWWLTRRVNKARKLYVKML